jgi:hypothetical protein
MAAVTTLPSAFVANTILTAAELNNLRGAFRILQVVNAQFTTQTTTTSTSFVTTGATATITPSSSSSKILVLTTGNIANSGATSAVRATMFRGTVAGTNLATGVTLSAAALIFPAIYANASMCFLDSPSTTSATTYTFGFATGNGTVTATAQADNISSLITLMEISA